MIPGVLGSARAADEDQVRTLSTFMMNSTAAVRGERGCGSRPRSRNPDTVGWVAGRCALVVARDGAEGVARAAVVAVGSNEFPRSSGKITQARARP